MDIKSLIRTVPNWPKPGIMFRDVTTLFNHADGLAETCRRLVETAREFEFDRIVAIESRGFVLGSVLAQLLHKPLVLARKPGKLPYKTIKEDYSLEYGTATLEVHTDAVRPGEKVLVVDDLLATGGTAAAVARLMDRMEARVSAFLFVIDLPEVGGRRLLTEKGHAVRFLVEFEGD